MPNIDGKREGRTDQKKANLNHNYHKEFSQPQHHTVTRQEFLSKLIHSAHT